MLSAFRSNGASSMRVHKKHDRHRQGIVIASTQDIGDNPLLRAFRTDVASTHSAIIRYTRSTGIFHQNISQISKRNSKKINEHVAQSFYANFDSKLLSKISGNTMIISNGRKPIL